MIARVCSLRFAGAALLLVLPGLALAQGASPGATLTQEAPPAITVTPAPPPLAALPRPPLLPNPGDPVDVDEVAIPQKPVVIATGTSTWDEGFANLRAAFRRIEEGAALAGIRPAGRPIAVFVETDETTFTYQAMIPIDQATAGAPALPAGLRFGTTPAGKAYRFVHKGPYDEIDSTYETITTYLDAKNITAKDAFIEEYANDAANSADTNLEVNIFVQPK